MGAGPRAGWRGSLRDRGAGEKGFGRRGEAGGGGTGRDAGRVLRAGMVRRRRVPGRGRDTHGFWRGGCGWAMPGGMTDPLNIVPRRLVPLVGPILWAAGEVAPNAQMIPLGAEHGAELEAARRELAAGLEGGATPRLDALVEELRGRLDHGRGFALLRGLPLSDAPEGVLRVLAGRLGAPVAAVPVTGSRHVEACDGLLLAATQPVVARLRSAAAIHNALLKADRAGLAALYEARGEPAVPVFSHEGGVFAGRWDDSVLPADRVPAAIEAAMGEPLALSLRAGDILALNPFLVWADRVEGAVAVAFRETPSRLDGAGFAALR